MHGVRQQDQGLVGEAAARLPWLCPSSDALVLLANDPVPVSDLSDDVGLVLLALRYVRSTTTTESFRFAALRESVVPEAAAKLLELHTKDWLPAAHPVAVQLQEFSRRLAKVARELAQHGEFVSPDVAAAVGLLAPLGWWAVATISPAAVEECLAALTSDPFGVQRSVWGFSHEEVARRLCAKWRLPAWLSATVTTLSLSVADAVRCGADPDLAQILRSAIERVEASGEFVGWLKPSKSNAQRSNPLPGAQSTAEDPRTLRLLPQLLRSAARTRRAGNEPRLRATEERVDHLQRLLADLRDGFEIAVRDSKLSGLAELAAGAGHEINNPLAVISGHAQRLRKTEVDADRRKSLDLIVRQSVRISEIVRDLMQFARPATPNRTAVNLRELVALTVAEFQPQASVKGIRLTADIQDDAISCHFDYAQVRKTLDAIVGNALEATPSGGEIRIVQRAIASRASIVVEDSGVGPHDAAVPHLFDPFFSGRSAGRGRGLGLATAWRLASINGGELHFHRGSDGPTRFELTFPTLEIAVPTLRKLA